MRARFIVLVVFILGVAAFAALNWSDFVQPTPRSLGVAIVQAPLGLIMLGLLGLALIAFLISSVSQETHNLIESRQHMRELTAQRDLADKAEASRFTDLRLHLDNQLRETRQREAIAAAEFEKAMVNGQRELRTQLEQLNRNMASRLDELESRLDPRLERDRSAAM